MPRDRKARMAAAPYSATMVTVRQFNTAGPVVAGDHYCIPPLERIDLDAVLGLIRDKKYFVLHAPRQTGKTSVLLALRDLLNGGTHGEFRCVYANVGVEQTRRYADRCGAEAGHLIVFDRAPERPWAEKIFRRAPSGDGVPVTVWGM